MSSSNILVFCNYSSIYSFTDSFIFILLRKYSVSFPLISNGFNNMDVDRDHSGYISMAEFTAGLRSN